MKSILLFLVFVSAVLFGISFQRQEVTLGTITRQESVRVMEELTNSFMPTLVIDSAGGSVIDSIYLADFLKQRPDIGCVVKSAQSAALQIIMPACKRLTIKDNVMLTFHRPLIPEIGTWDQTDNEEMRKHLIMIEVFMFGEITRLFNKIDTEILLELYYAEATVSFGDLKQLYR